MKKTKSADLVELQTRIMQDEHILRWLIEFGTDWVDDRTLSGTWADDGFYWHDAKVEGLLELKNEVVEGRPLTHAYKLTQKALDRLSNKVHEGELSYE